MCARGLFGVPALAGRAEPLRAGERGTAWLIAFHVIPAYRHTIEVIEVDDAEQTIRTHEHGGVLRAWNHTLRVEPIDTQTCRYTDTVEIDAGPQRLFVAAARGRHIPLPAAALAQARPPALAAAGPRLCELSAPVSFDVMLSPGRCSHGWCWRRCAGLWPSAAARSWRLRRGGAARRTGRHATEGIVASLRQVARTRRQHTGTRRQHHQGSASRWCGMTRVIEPGQCADTRRRSPVTRRIPTSANSSTS